MGLEYPRDRDLLWMASDAKGHVGVFLTAGQGPIPTQVLSRLEELCETEEEISHLRRLGGHRLLVSVPKPDDLIALAEQGFFVYDWQDAHRSAANASHRYELVSIPDNPVLIGDLQERLAGLAVALEGFDFERGVALDVRSMVDCCMRDS
ncbi:hypothetical protein [Dyella sp. 2RAB6]|uniref:hypothetical protein n=1 Tax=Dyella sp. 2RAB6 TaxID=3232992 RepID=UPI003F8DD5B0